MKPRWYQGANLLQIAMPMGGIGAGSICLSGYGALQDFSIRHKPDTTALADGHSHGPAAFALLRIKGAKGVTRVVEGPVPVERIYDQGLQAQGYRKGGYEGMPHFKQARFRAEYPFGHIELTDPDVPLKVRLTGWSPFVPEDDVASGVPCAILEYTLRNPTRKTIECELSYHLSHLAVGEKGDIGSRNAVIPGKGVLFTNTDAPHGVRFGSASLSVVGHESRIKGMWLRGPSWTYESITALWREVSESRFSENEGNASDDIDGRNGGSVLVSLKLKPGEEVTVPFVITWHFPNVYEVVGRVKDEQSCSCESGCCDNTPKPAWQPWYVTRWSDAGAVAQYVASNYADLKQRTRGFAQALYSSTLPDALLESIGSNLAILKSPTVLRQANGNVWGWEGCFCTSGCCHGSCTHVWNYAQSLPNLFPALERTLREAELVRSMQEDGRVYFRAALPDGKSDFGWHAAADGQLGGILKLYRDWQICGDEQWLRKMYPLARKSLDYSIAHWDPDQKGALFEPHHNTYDIEFWGSDGMCTSIYCSALAAAAAMAEHLGEEADARRYHKLAQRSAEYLKAKLFNGQYFDQKVMWNELKSSGQFKEMLAKLKPSERELAGILSTEGPRFQYGSGCISDGVIGAWMALIYGVESPQDRKLVRKHLKSIYRHNFRKDLSKHVCTQRPGYAMGHEPGLILCTWPKGGKPTLPFIYSDEVWTGIEYQVASHMIAEGMVEEGLEIVQGIRKRYDGHVRNPFNEYECGSYYARAMASYALLGAYSGFRYSAVERTLWLDPKTTRRPFRTFFSTASGHGTIELSTKAVRIELLEGELPLKRINVGGRELDCDVMVAAGKKMTMPLAAKRSETMKRVV